MARILEDTRTLSDSPERGRRVPESQRLDVRELIFGNYRVFYQVTPDTVRILDVIHGARKFFPLP
jgi:toxin ParE1/3/4